MVTTDFSGFKDESFSSALQPDGMLIVAGHAKDSSKFNIAIARYLNDALPPRLLSFSAVKHNKTNILQWQTAQEQNTDKFLAERSADQKNLFLYRLHTAAGNNPLSKNYSFTDAEPLTGTNFYRLKMIDKNGKFTYSKVVSIVSGLLSHTLHVFPNPAKDILQVQAPSVKGNAVIQIQDATGKTLHQQTVKLSGSSITIDIHNLAKGKYYVTLHGTAMYVAEFIKL